MELWDFAYLLHQGAPQVLGQGSTEWRQDPKPIEYLTRARPWPKEALSRWGLFKDPLPPRSEHPAIRYIRDSEGLADSRLQGPRWEQLSSSDQQDFLDAWDEISAQHNPIIRRIIRRTRPMLEERGLLPRIAVRNHPNHADRLPERLFDGQGLQMGPAFREAYETAEQFCRVYAAQRPGAGFLKTILLRRIGSSPVAGLSTAQAMLDRAEDAGIDQTEVGDCEGTPRSASPLNGGEQALLRTVVRSLEAVVLEPDPKVEVILQYLRNKDWLGSTVPSCSANTSQPHNG